MRRLRPALAALALLAALPAAAEAERSHPVLHVSAGTGACPRASSPTSRSANPCWLLFGASGGLRLGPVEVGAVYEGREPADLLTLFLVRPSAVTVLGGTVAAVAEPGERWRLALGGEAGWRRYANFAGSGVRDWAGAADTAYAGVTGRAAFGVRSGARTDRLEVTLAWRKDVKTATDFVENEAWRVGGWSITMGVGLVAEW
ncbi:MAG TPA: hypothetical protein VFP50_04795 [Anaeromyxobacteraceae bacterium]|nr:hypothetical protein [Anaeromyxobacteraceae bacterium]